MFPCLRVGVASQAIRLLEDVYLMFGALQRPCSTEASTTATDDGNAFTVCRESICESHVVIMSRLDAGEPRRQISEFEVKQDELYSRLRIIGAPRDQLITTKTTVGDVLESRTDIIAWRR